MSTLTALARAQAVSRGVAQPVATVRHVHLSDRPLVLIALTLAGEANAPLAAMVGDEARSPRLLVVSQPRNRDERFAFAAQLAEVVVSYIDDCRSTTETWSSGAGGEARERYATAPQIILPNTASFGFVRLLGRSTRFRRSSGEYAVDAAVPVLGRWLTFFAERAEQGRGSPSLGADGLDRPAARHDGTRSRGRRRGRADLAARRPRHRPDFRQRGTGAPDYRVRPYRHGDSPAADGRVCFGERTRRTTR